MPNAVQIAMGRQTPLTAGLMMAILTEAPLLSAMDVRATSGTNFLSLAVTSLPNSQFANLNEGFESSEGEMALREFACAMIGGLVKADVLAAAKWLREHPGVGYSWFDLQLMLKLKADMLQVERQIIRGTAHDPKGFPGTKEMTPFITANVFGMDDTPSDSDFEKSVLNVGGTEANKASSVYSFVFGDLDCQMIVGDDDGSGEMIKVGERRVQNIAPNPAVPNKTSDHELCQVHGYMGFSVGAFNQQEAGQTVPTQYSLRRAANVTTQEGFTCDDEVLENLVNSHGTGKRPNLIAMSHRSRKQLAKSRNPNQTTFLMGSGDAANNTFKQVASLPTNYDGIPIVCPNADVIGNADPIEVAA